MKKNLLVILFCVCLLFGLTGCNQIDSKVSLTVKEGTTAPAAAKRDKCLGGF